MNNISQAYIHCVDRYSSCPIYRRLSEELLVQSCGQKHEEAAVLELASA